MRHKSRVEADVYRKIADWFDSDSKVVCNGYDDGCRDSLKRPGAGWIAKTVHIHSALAGPFRPYDPGGSASLSGCRSQGLI